MSNITVSKRSINVRYFYLIVGVISLFFAGIIYAWSIVKVPLITEFPQWEASSLDLNYTIMISCFCLGNMIPGFLSKFMSQKLIIILGGVMTCAGYIISSFMTGNILVLYLAYGILGGLGIGCSYNELLTVINSWFPEKRGLSNGVLMMSYGLSTFLLGKVADALINMDAVGWRNTYRILGIAVGVFMLISALIVKFPGKDVELPTPKAGKINNISPVDYTPVQMLKRSSFWRFFIVLILTASLGSVAISSGRQIMEGMGASSSLATTVVGLLAISNGAGRVLIGLVFDKIGFVKSKIIAGIVNILGALFIIAALVFSSIPLGIVGFCLAGANYGTGPTLESFMCSAFFGTKYFSTNMAIINLHLLVSSFIAPLVTKLNVVTGSYLIPFVIVLGMGVVAFVINLTIKKA